MARSALVGPRCRDLLVTISADDRFAVRVCVDRQSSACFCVKSVLKRGNIRNLTLLQNEIALLQQIRHRHIVSVIECIQDSDYVHIVMQKCDGGDLFERIIDQDIRLEESRVCEIMCCVMDAISYVQEMDVVHRDLKVCGKKIRSNGRWLILSLSSGRTLDALRRQSQLPCCHHRLGIGNYSFRRRPADDSFCRFGLLCCARSYKAIL